MKPWVGLSSRFIVGAAISAAAWAPWLTTQAQDTWTREQYTSENGLLQNRVHAMVLDQWGALVIGTEGGLVRFDGVNFKQIGIPAAEGLRPSRVLEILPVPGDAFIIRDAGSRQYLYSAKELTSITGDAPARKPTSRFGGGKIPRKATVNALDPDSTMEGKSNWPYGVRLVSLGQDKWCIRSETELFVYEHERLVDRFDIPHGKWSHLFTIERVPYMFDSLGTIYRIDVSTQTWEVMPTQGLPQRADTGQRDWRLLWDPGSESVSLLTPEGLYALGPMPDGKGLQAEFVPLELPTNCHIGSALRTANKQVWALGTDTKGLYIYHRNSMRSILCETGGEGANNVYFAQAPYGRDGVITSTRGRSRLIDATGCAEEGLAIKGFDEAAILLDRDGRYWYGREDTLYRYNETLAHEEVISTGLRPLCFMEENDGTIQVGAATGIYKLVADTLVLAYPMEHADLSYRPTAMCIAPDGDLWVATCAGVFRAKQGQELSLMEPLAGVCARALAVVNGGVFIGTYGSGAFLYKEGKLMHLPTDNEDFLSHVHAFLADDAGFLWMSTNQGLFRVKLSDIDHWTRNTRHELYFAYYGKHSGIANSEFNGGCSPAFVRTGNGWASFPTMDGLVWFKPEEVPDAYPQRPILLEGVEVDGRRIMPDDGYTLEWSHKNVVVEYSLAYWGDPENAKLEYSLSNNAGQWTRIRPGQRQLSLAKLPGRKVDLVIRKVGSHSRGNEKALMVKFIIPPPYYRTAWFIAGSILLGAFLLYTVIRLNAARLRRRNLQLEEMVAQRTGELTSTNAVLRRSLEMKEMLVSIISHDIVTPLRFIARVSDGTATRWQKQDPELLSDTLYDIARSTDKLYNNAEGLLQWIKRQDDRIELRIRNEALHPLVGRVLEMQRERALDKGIELINDVPLDDVIRTDSNILSIILNNLVVNAVTHTKEGYVKVSGASVNGTYSIEVADTGSGMPDAAFRHALRLQGKGALGAMNEEGERDVQGLGLLIVADLLQMLGASFSVQTARGKGTTFTISIPVQKVG